MLTHLLVIMMRRLLLNLGLLRPKLIFVVKLDFWYVLKFNASFLSIQTWPILVYLVHYEHALAVNK